MENFRFGQQQGQLLLWQAHHAAVRGAVDHGDGLTPVALAGKDPVPQLVAHGGLAQPPGGEIGGDLLLELGGGQAGVPAGVDRRPVAGVGLARLGLDPFEVAATIRAAMEYVPPERLYPCTNCGMVPLRRELSLAKLEALAAGACIVRDELA